MKCKNCNTEYNGKFCPECGTKAELQDEAIGTEKPSISTNGGKQIKFKINKGMLIAGAVIAGLLLIVALASMSFLGKPANLDEQSYKAGVKALEYTDQYLDYKIDAKTAEDAIKSIDKSLSKTPNTNTSVELTISSIYQYISFNSYDKVLECRNTLASKLNKFKR